MSKIHINNTTLFGICWGDKYLPLTLRPIIASLKNVSFDKIVLIIDEDNNTLSDYTNVIDFFDIKIIKKPLKLIEDADTDKSRIDYSSIFTKLLAEFCDQEFILTIQPDSCIINADKWSNEFFEYDYIGAPWPMEIVKAVDMASDKVEVENFVGNGGFSLRSRKYIQTSLSMPTLHKNEDLNLCVFNYKSMVKEGIKFAPIDLAASFSVEHPLTQKVIYDRKFLLTYNSFGFHGEFNIAGMKYIYQNSKEIL